jgi:hypothetical protein
LSSLLLSEVFISVIIFIGVVVIIVIVIITMHMLLTLWLATLAVASTRAVRRTEPAKLLRGREQDIVPDKYIVKLRDGVDALSDLAISAERVYNTTGFSGYAAYLNPTELDSVRFNTDVSPEYHLSFVVIIANENTTDKITKPPTG